jgi:hypothetical protein
MRHALTVVGTSLGLPLSNPVASLAQTPDAIIELSGGSVAAGIGYSWGHGTLIFHGERYPIAVSGLSLATVGVVGYSASGEVVTLGRTLGDLVVVEKGVSEGESVIVGNLQKIGPGAAVLPEPAAVGEQPSSSSF